MSNLFFKIKSKLMLGACVVDSLQPPLPKTKKWPGHSLLSRGWLSTSKLPFFAVSYRKQWVALYLCVQQVWGNGYTHYTPPWLSCCLTNSNSRAVLLLVG